MLHAKFQDHRTSGSGDDFKGFYHIWALGPFGHVTWPIYINFGSPFQKILHIKLGFE